MKRRCGDDQYGGIDEQRECQRDRRIDESKAHGFTFAFECLFVLTSLHDRRMQVEIVGHDGSTQYANGDVKHRGGADNLGLWKKSAQYCAQWWLGEDSFE